MSSQSWNAVKNKQKVALCEALDKVKGELMVLGFVSLLLTFSQGYISRMCISSSIGNKMLPCTPLKLESSTSDHETDRRLLGIGRTILSTGSSNHKCEEIRKWKNWEGEISSPDYESSHVASGYRRTNDLPFVKTHSSFWTRIPFFFYVGCFCRQFIKSVDKSDYSTLRNGFITAHIAPGCKFDFHKYIKRSLEEDFGMVVGVSPVLWASFVIFLRLNVNGWHTLFWASIIPLIVILAIGTKLQAILTRMALGIAERHTVVQGTPRVEGSDTYFWFSNPRLLLHLLHFTLFQNAFQITYLLWILYQFEPKSCLHENLPLEFVKITFGIGAMVVCSYSTLPLYALVSQMGSHMKKNVFDEQTTKALKELHGAGKKKNEGWADKTHPRTIGVASSKSLTSSSRKHSSGQILHRVMSMGCLSHAADSGELQEGEEDSTLDTLIVRVNNDQDKREINMATNVSEIREEDDTRYVRSSSLN